MRATPSGSSSNAATWVLVALAAIAVGLMVRQQFFNSHAAQSLASHRVRELSNWTEIRSTGHTLGTVGGVITIVEFGDYECPVCATFERRVLAGLRKRYSEQVSIVFRNWPLSYHRFAYPAARAAECADQQGRYVAFHDLLYAKQDSLGLKSFVSFAKESGIQDTESFVRCNSAVGKVPRIETDAALAEQIGGTGTPTVIVEGMILGFVPDSQTMDSVIQAALARRRAKP